MSSPTQRDMRLRRCRDYLECDDSVSSYISVKRSFQSKGYLKPTNKVKARRKNAFVPTPHLLAGGWQNSGLPESS